MSRINFHRNTFLEKEELNRMAEFTAEKTMLDAILSISENKGIVAPSKDERKGLYLAKNFVGKTNVSISEGYAITALDGYPLEAYHTGNVLFDITTPQGGIYASSFDANIGKLDTEQHIVRASCVKVHSELGIVSVQKNGVCSGTVNFREIARVAASSSVPVCIRFVRDRFKWYDSATDTGTVLNLWEETNEGVLNNSVYEIADIISDTSVKLTFGGAFYEEDNLQVVVLGSIPIGRAFTEEQLEGLYTYNRILFDCALRNTPLNQARYPYLKKLQFLIGVVSIKSDGSGSIIQTVDAKHKDIWIPEVGLSYWTLGGGSTSSSVKTATITFKIPTPANPKIVRVGSPNIIENFSTYSTTYSDSDVSTEFIISAPGYKTVRVSWEFETQNGMVYDTPMEQGTETTYTLIVKTENGSTDEGSISVDSMDVWVGTSPSITVIDGQSVVLRARPVGDSVFLGWYTSEGALVSTDINLYYTVTGDVTLIAKFGKFETFCPLIRKGVWDDGMDLRASITSSESTIPMFVLMDEDDKASTGDNIQTMPANNEWGSATRIPGSTYRYEAAPKNGYTVIGFTVYDSKTDTVGRRMDGNLIDLGSTIPYRVVAYFMPTEPTSNITINPPGSSEIEASISGNVIRLQCSPNNGFTFSHWYTSSRDTIPTQILELSKWDYHNYYPLTCTCTGTGGDGGSPTGTILDTLPTGNVGGTLTSSASGFTATPQEGYKFAGFFKYVDDAAEGEFEQATNYDGQTKQFDGLYKLVASFVPVVNEEIQKYITYKPANVTGSVFRGELNSSSNNLRYFLRGEFNDNWELIVIGRDDNHSLPENVTQNAFIVDAAQFWENFPVTATYTQREIFDYETICECVPANSGVAQLLQRVDTAGMGKVSYSGGVIANEGFVSDYYKIEFSGGQLKYIYSPAKQWSKDKPEKITAYMVKSDEGFVQLYDGNSDYFTVVVNGDTNMGAQCTLTATNAIGSPLGFKSWEFYEISNDELKRTQTIEENPYTFTVSEKFHFVRTEAKKL